MVHMQALTVLLNFPYPKTWIHILRYENTTFTRQNLTVLWSSVAVSEQWLSQPNLKTFLNELQVFYMNFETAKYEHSLRAKSFVRTAVFAGGSILAVDWCLKSTNFKPLCAVLRIFVGALAVCVAPAANKEQTQIASAQTIALFIQPCTSEMCHFP